MTSVTREGFSRTRLAERLEEIKDAYRGIFGEDIQVDPDDVDGQTLGIFAERISDLDQLAEAVYHSLNPQTAYGVALSRLVQFNGIRRQAGAYSMVDLSLRGSPGVTVPAGSLVKSTLDNSTWTTLSAATFDGNGDAAVTARCLGMGPVYASAGSVTKIDTPIYGWHSVTNPAIATLGKHEETDQELRIRRRGATNTPAQCITDAIHGSLSDLSGVRAVKVYENYADVADSNGQAPHSIHCVVEGGSLSEIAAVIWLKKTAGTTMVGAVAKTVVDSQGFSQPVRFSRPSYISPYITVTVRKGTAYPTDGGARIKSALVDYGLTLDIGEDLLNGRLYTPANTVPAHNVNSIYVGTSPNPTAEANIQAAYNQLVVVSPDRIVVNEL